MNAAVVSVIVFVSTLGAAIGATYLAPRLPADHLSDASRDAIKLTMAMLATLTALVVGLLIGSVRSSFEGKDLDVKRVAAQIIAMDRVMARYGPEAEDARSLLRQAVERRFHEFWSAGGEGGINTNALSQGAGFEVVQDRILQLSPRNDAQRWLQSKAVQISGDIADSRWLLVQRLPGSIPWPVLVILAFWLTILFFSFGLFAPRNGTVVAVFAVGALSVAGSVYLILAMDQPYGRFFGLSSDPFRSVLTALGQDITP